MSSGKTILIIDDETDLCLLLKAYFVRKNYHVYVSNTLQEGTQILQAIKPDVLFLDNNLPDGLGWNSAPDIARSFPFTYIVLISAFHPELPPMPANANYRVIEKPMTMLELDAQFTFVE
jgi:DNA-binding response OmpR family regulator